MEKIYIVRYYGGSYDNHYEVLLFATTKKSIATKYVTKFNTILEKWKTYYSQFEEDKYGIGIKQLKDEYIEEYYDRWSSLRNVSRCYYDELNVR